ncbi:MAG TPA: HAD family hydrolase [Gammaproteobacteria bacterium]|nr:HAD family hydrolase [Gammaproteobacteria bacterium]
MAAIEALIFDVDGTLADTERDGHRVAFNRAFADAGLDWEWDVPLYGRLLAVTGGKERIRHYLSEYNRDFRPPPDLDAFVADLHAAKTAHYKALMAEGRVPLRPGVERLLREARAAGIPLAIATTTTMDNVTALLENTLGSESIGWFAEIGAGDIVPRKKPAPDIYDWVLERLGLSPERVVAFEDSGHGVTSAADAGIRRILVTTNDYTRDQDFSRAALVLDQLGEPGSPPRTASGEPLQGPVNLALLEALPA